MKRDSVSYERVVWNGNLNTSYSQDDFVNADCFDPHDSKQRAFVVLNAGYILAIVFAEYPAFGDQDALDTAADSGKLDGLQCSESELADYEIGRDSEGYPEYEGIVNLGNASEPFASESLDMWTLPAAVFGEDPFLMTHGRVMNYLEAQEEAAERLYQDTDVYSADHLRVFKAREDARDARTLARLIGGGR